MTKPGKPKAPPPSQAQEGKQNSFSETLSTLFKPLIIALATSCASIFAYVLTPLGEMVNSKIWNEKAEIQIISQSPNPKQGDVIPVDVFIQSVAPVALTDGILKISYSPGTLRPGAETAPLLAIKTGKINTSTKPFDRTLEFIADSAGKGEITATLETKTGTFQKKISFEILQPSDQTYPTRRSFTGNWNIDLGGIPGHMELIDVARNLTGTYTLSDGNRGQIEGSHDGKTFRVTFYRGSAPSRYFVDAVFDPNPAMDLELRGAAKLLVPTGNTNVPWKNEHQSEFYAVAKAR